MSSLSIATNIFATGPSTSNSIPSPAVFVGDQFAVESLDVKLEPFADLLVADQLVVEPLDLAEVVGRTQPSTATERLHGHGRDDRGDRLGLDDAGRVPVRGDAGSRSSSIWRGAGAGGEGLAAEGAGSRERRV